VAHVDEARLHRLRERRSDGRHLASHTMCHIIHERRDDRCLTVLGTIRKAIPATGRLPIIETVLPAANDSSPFRALSMATVIVVPVAVRATHPHRPACNPARNAC
jgi:hypothetical protein